MRASSYQISHRSSLMNITSPHTCDVWVYFDILKRFCGLPQAEKLVYDIIRVCMNKSGYYEADTTPGLWCQKWCPIIFGIIVDNFGIEQVGERHSQHLLHILQEHYINTTYWEGGGFAGVDLYWTYVDKHS